MDQKENSHLKKVQSIVRYLRNVSDPRKMEDGFRRKRTSGTAIPPSH